MSQDPSPTVVLGFDALSFRYLDAFDCPNVEALRSRGVEAPLDSTFPPWTGSAWPSMYTGVDPSHHGCYSFFDFGAGYPDDADVIERNDVRAPALWNYLSARDVSSIVLNVPVTHPAEEIEGALMPGYLAPEDAAGYPDSLRDDLDDALGEPYRIYADVDDATSEERLAEYEALIDLRRRAARELLTERDWQFALVQVQKTDAVFHNFDDAAAFRRIYEAADDLVGTVLDAVDDDVNVIVCSDHGIGPTDGYNVYVNEVLRQHGLVEATTDGETPTLGGAKSRLAGEGEGDADHADRGLSARAVSTAAAALNAVGLTPGDAYAIARRLGVDSALQRILPEGAGESIGEHVDWRASAAYCRSGPELGVRINLAGREADGVVPQSEYDAVRDRIVRLLSDLETPDGRPAFEWVKRREEVYDGAYAEDACDVLFMPAEMNNLVATNLLGKRFVTVDKFNHKREGVFVGAGPAFDDAAEIDRLSLTDVAPIVMGTLERPVPARMTGSIPDGLLSGPVRIDDYPDLQYGTAEGGGADEQVEARLEDLGYL